MAQGGGFGNDADTPLAMIKTGFESVVAGMAAHPGITVVLNASVTQINRLGNAARVTYKDTSTGIAYARTCDLVALTGHITPLVVGAYNRSQGKHVPGWHVPVLQPPTKQEVELFGTKTTMQFLVSLIEFNGAPKRFKAIEYWPNEFHEDGAVILHRDVGFVTQGTRHAMGGG